MPQADYALITGASSGIGESFARALAARSRNVVLVARSKEKLVALATELRASHGVSVETLNCDLSLVGAAARLAQELGERHLGIDLLVNNAGFGAHGQFWRLDFERQSQMIRLNIQTVVELTYFLLPSLIEKRRGGVINVASTAGFQPVPYTTLYAATKAFVTSFSLALAAEVRPYGVAVVTLCPGGTRTNFFEAGQYGRPKLLGSLQAPDAVAEMGLRVLERGGGLTLPRLTDRLGVFLQRFVPRQMVVKIAARMFQP